MAAPLLLTTLLGTLLVSALAAAPAAAAGPTGVLVGRVIRVQDGDSLVLSTAGHQLVVRLAGIDAPELEQPWGRAARDLLRNCTAGRHVVVTVLTTDRHGRPVGVVDTKGEDCGLAQLRAGLAWHYRAYAETLPVAQRQSYDTAERVARRARIGLWRDADPEPPWQWRRQNPRIRPGAAR